MNKNVALLSLITLATLSTNTHCGAKIKAEVETPKLHDIKVWAKRTGLYAAPFLISNVIMEAMVNHGDHTKPAKKLCGIRQTQIIHPLLIGAFGAYFWPKANNVK